MANTDGFDTRIHLHLLNTLRDIFSAPEYIYFTNYIARHIAYCLIPLEHIVVEHQPIKAALSVCKNAQIAIYNSSDTFDHQNSIPKTLFNAN